MIGGAIGYVIGTHRGRAWDGCALGAVLGPIGWLLVGFGPNRLRKCPACLGPVLPGATKCRHCASDLSAVAPSPEVPAYARLVKCPACGQSNEATFEQLSAGLRCQKCKVGFMPE